MRMYSAQQIATDVICRYSADDLLTELKTKGEIDKIRKVLERICRQTMVEGGTTLWEKSTATKGKATRHEFSKDEKESLMQSPELLRYLLAHPNDYPKAKELLEDTEEAERRNTETHDYMSRMAFDEDFRREEEDKEKFGVSWEEVRKVKFMLMIEALFLRHFTPIDELKLKEDLDLYKLGGGGEDIPETIAAERRLMTVTSYCEKRK